MSKQNNFSSFAVFVGSIVSVCTVDESKADLRTMISRLVQDGLAQNSMINPTVRIYGLGGVGDSRLTYMRIGDVEINRFIERAVINAPLKFATLELAQKAFGDWRDIPMTEADEYQERFTIKAISKYFPDLWKETIEGGWMIPYSKLKPFIAEARDKYSEHVKSESACKFDPTRHYPQPEFGGQFGCFSSPAPGATNPLNMTIMQLEQTIAATESQLNMMRYQLQTIKQLAGVQSMSPSPYVHQGPYASPIAPGQVNPHKENMTAKQSQFRTVDDQ
ncbi:hypothetical protein [Vibrio phage BONAISHI]|nr:hypothetical protein [Vibrio phage BONAISHI]